MTTKLLILLCLLTFGNSAHAVTVGITNGSIQMTACDFPDCSALSYQLLGEDFSLLGQGAGVQTTAPVAPVTVIPGTLVAFDSQLHVNGSVIYQRQTLAVDVGTLTFATTPIPAPEKGPGVSVTTDMAMTGTIQAENQGTHQTVTFNLNGAGTAEHS